jgi:hypothetical protein
LVKNGLIIIINENILKALLTTLNSTSSHHINFISNMFINWIHFVLLFLHWNNLVEAFDGDPYKILGVKKSASQSEIKKAYRQKAKEVCVSEWER